MKSSLLGSIEVGTVKGIDYSYYYEEHLKDAHTIHIDIKPA